jgi:hypothetical protein
VKMSKHVLVIFGLIAIVSVIEVVFREGPSYDVGQTKQLKKISSAIEKYGLSGCDVLQRTYLYERCVLKTVPDVKEIDNLLMSKGWRQTDNHIYTGNKFAAWCKDDATIYLGTSRGEWELAYSNSPGNRCRDTH